MIRTFADATTEDLWNGENTRAARAVPRELWGVVGRKLDMLNAASELLDLRAPPGNRLERLKGRHSAFHSIRVNDQYRIVFKWNLGGAEDVRITDYH